MALSHIIPLGWNLVQEIYRGSGWVDVGSLYTAAPLLINQAMHDDLINFNGIYIAKNEKIRISQLEINQYASSLATGEAVVTGRKLELALFNTDGITPTGGSEITFPSGYTAADLLCVIDIPTTAWRAYKTGYVYGFVEPGIIVSGSINDANTGINIHGILLDGAGGPAFPAAAVMQMRLQTELIGNADDE